MESANHHHHHHQQQLQDLQLLGSSSSSSLETEASCYGVSTTHSWSPHASLNGGIFNQSYTGEILNTRQSSDSDYMNLNSNLHNNSMVQQWQQHQSSYDHHHQNLVKIKNEDSSSSSDILNNPATKDLNDLSEKLLLKTLSSGFPMINGEFQPYRRNFSQIYPSVNISNLMNQSHRMNTNPRSFDMNLQALDGTLFSESSLINPASSLDSTNLGMYKGISLPFGLGAPLQQSVLHQPSCSPSDQMSRFNNVHTSEARRPGSLVDAKGGKAAAKKPRVESRASCPPLKVRKEKLGDRIAALQQLVAPFGKTDTASVLMEAVGYIKFLQNQVETLSVPYMRSSSRNRTSKISQRGSTTEEGDEESKRDLRSRGLCLVPMSCMTYVAGDGGVGGGGGGFWPLPPGFGGGT